MIFKWLKQYESNEKNYSSRRTPPARWGLLLGVVCCLALAGWELVSRGSDGSITLEQALVDAEAVVQPSAVDATPVDGDASAAAASDPTAPDAAAGSDEAAESGQRGAAAATEVAADSAAAMFAAYRLEREASRAQELELLAQIIDDPEGSQAAREGAEQRRLAVAAAIEHETAAETLLDAKGYGESMVLVSDGQATVICNVELNAAAAAGIAAIVAEACQVSFENVVIVNR